MRRDYTDCTDSGKHHCAIDAKYRSGLREIGEMDAKSIYFHADSYNAHDEAIFSARLHNCLANRVCAAKNAFGSRADGRMPNSV